MAISAKDVKRLRDMTSAGMMDCKKALTETDGDFDAAIEVLQKKMRGKLDTKADRVAAEGLIGAWTSDDQREAVLVEINSETDFVARNEDFIAFVDTVAKAIGESGIESMDQFEQVMVEGKTLPEFAKDKVASIGEKIEIRRFERLSVEEGIVGAYLHMGSQVGAMVKVRGEQNEEFARDIAMHVAASRPLYLSEAQVDPEASKKQEELLTMLLKEEGKPEKIIPNILRGQMSKWRAESTLLDQGFVKDDKRSVKQYQEDTGGVEIVEYVCLEVGEGIEKKESDLAAEVAATLKG